MLVDLFVSVVLVTDPLFSETPSTDQQATQSQLHIEEVASLSFVCCSNYFLQFLFI